MRRGINTIIIFKREILLKLEGRWVIIIIEQIIFILNPALSIGKEIFHFEIQILITKLFLFKILSSLSLSLVEIFFL